MLQQEGGAFNKSCPDHLFLPGVRVTCYTQRDSPPFLRIQAMSTVAFHLSYASDAQGYNANDDTPLQQPSTPPLYINIPSYIPSSGDFSAFLVDQGASRSDYIDRLVGVALDGVPIYTALGPGGQNLLGQGGNLGQSRYAVDSCGGSYGPTPDGVRYHYRTMPACILVPRGLNKRGFQDRRQVYVSSTHDLLDGFEDTTADAGPQIVAWALTGHPMYSPLTARGLEHTDLDNCNGKFARTGLHDAANSSLTYGFYTTTTFPYLVGCFGPGVYTLKEEGSSLEALPGRVGGRRFDDCPGGYVPTPDRATDGCIPCPAGRYSTASTHRPTAEVGMVLNTLTGCAGTCPIGTFCPPASTKPLKCPPGRYGGSTGLTDAGCSGACESGYFCPSGSTSARPFVCGNSSVYCPSGVAARQSVDVGFYTVPESSQQRTPSSSRNLAGAASSIDYDDTTRMAQQPCVPGTYCMAGLRHLCPAGVYGETSFLSSAACTAPCPAGSYCPIGSAHPTLCPAGTFGATTGLSAAPCSGLCVAGFWCPAGSTSAQQVPCKAGRYGAEAGLFSEECSLLCELAGAPNGTASAGSRYCEPRSCQAGYVCPPASISATQVACGSPAVYCPPHSVIPTPVSVGWYSIGNVSAAGQMQQAQDAATRSSQNKCEPGYWCSGGIRYPCQMGYFGGVAGLSTAACSGPCDPGFICLLASVSARALPCGMGPDTYCPRGSGASIMVPAGFYSVNGTLTTRSAVLPCPPGMYCLSGTKRNCLAGTYSVSGSATEACDGYCSAGYYCLEQSASATEYPCPAGRYGHIGMTNAACKGQCLAGYYCPAASTTPYQHECGGENFYCPAASGAPLPIAHGYYSSGANNTIRIRQDYCEINMYYSTPAAGRHRHAICPDTIH